MRKVVVWGFILLLGQSNPGFSGSAENCSSLSKEANSDCEVGAETEALSHREQVIKFIPQKPEMVSIPGGTFQMGSNDSGDEQPVHQVTMAAFNMGKTEITFAQWDACVAAGGCSHQPDDEGWGRGDHPVINVSYNDITQQYIPWLNQVSSENYRLPSEAEWEYAARANSTSRYHWGDTASHNYANYGQDEAEEHCCGGLARGKDRWVNTAPAGSFSPNAFGLYDMHGNVWEWTQDCWNNHYMDAPNNGQAWLSGICSTRVLRGGSWYVTSNIMRSANRFRTGLSNHDANIGFRLAQDR
jgi:formylglycine-generating enzyme required for sulfatase activity